MAAHKRDRSSHQNFGKTSDKPKYHNVKPEKKIETKFDTLYYISILFLAVSFACLHSYHVSTLFENDRHFSHLSTLEREMTFWSEMGMYYSYYKTIVESPSISDGFHEIIHNNITEYPSTINTLKRFNLFPEVTLGILYRMLDWFCDKFDIVGKQCWQIERGQGLSPVHSCEGLRQPEYFYLAAVWLSAGLTAAVLFLYGILLSDSIIGGVIATLSFFYNHSECTRVQWTPPLRESFAYPFCLLQMLCVSYCLKKNMNTYETSFSYHATKFQMLAVYLSSSICLTLWQFSQFILATQLIAVLILFSFGFISRSTTLVILIGQMLGVGQTLILLFGNELLLRSVLSCLLVASLGTLLFLRGTSRPLQSPPPAKVSLWRGSLTLLVILSIAIVLKTRAFTTSHDTHIMNIFRSKVSSYRDFHTLLYTCSAEFDFLGWEPIVKLSKSLLLPVVALLLINLLARSYFHQFRLRCIDPHIAYNILQLGAFSVMAIMIMRLKLFFTPHLCIIAALIASRKIFKNIQMEYHISVLVVLIGCMSVPGISNLLEQHSILGEYSNVELEELLIWVSGQTPKNVVFAGPMPITAAILVSTRRPVVNHPHYEDALLRERTKKVYSAFSRKPPEEIFKILSSLQVEYLVLSESWCFNQYRGGCRMTDLWDVEEPENRGLPPSCPKLFQGVFPFRLVFHNDVYAVLRLQPPYVELKGFSKY